MKMEWYYADANDNQFGPVTEAQLKTLMIEGKVTRNTMVWKDGMAEWVSAESTPLQDNFPATSPPLMKVSKPASPTSSATVDSFDRDDSKVYPQNPPRSVHLNWLNLLGPGLSQVVYGKVWMGVCGIALNTTLNVLATLLGLDAFNYWAMQLGLLAIVVVDGYMTARVLQQGQPVGKWQFFPRNNSPMTR